MTPRPFPCPACNERAYLYNGKRNADGEMVKYRECRTCGKSFTTTANEAGAEIFRDWVKSRHEVSSPKPAPVTVIFPCGHKAKRGRRECDTCREIEARRQANEAQPLAANYITPQYRQWWRDILAEIRANG